MYKIAILGCAVLSASLAPCRAAAAQAASATFESNVTRLLHRDSLSILTLTNRNVVFEYTSAGMAYMRHRVDSTTATYPGGAMATLVRKSVVGALQGMRMEFPIRDMVRAEATGATVLITFNGSSHASDDPTNHSFEFDAVDANAARSFVLRLTGLLDRRQ